MAQYLKVSVKGSEGVDEGLDVKEELCVHLHSSWIECVVCALKGCLYGVPWVLVGSATTRFRRLEGFERAFRLGALFGSFRLTSCALSRLSDVLLRRGDTSMLGEFVRRYTSAIAGFGGAAAFVSGDSDIQVKRPP